MRDGYPRDLDLEPVDVPMDAEALRAHPLGGAVRLGRRREAERRRDVGARAARRRRSLILNGHIDVVSPEPLSQWGDRDPFGGRLEDELAATGGAPPT